MAGKGFIRSSKVFRLDFNLDWSTEVSQTGADILTPEGGRWEWEEQNIFWIFPWKYLYSQLKDFQPCIICDRKYGVMESAAIFKKSL